MGEKVQIFILLNPESYTEGTNTTERGDSSETSLSLFITRLMRTKCQGETETEQFNSGSGSPFPLLCIIYTDGINLAFKKGMEDFSFSAVIYIFLYAFL